MYTNASIQAHIKKTHRIYSSIPCTTILNQHIVAYKRGNKQLQSHLSPLSPSDLIVRFNRTFNKLYRFLSETLEKEHSKRTLFSYTRIHVQYCISPLGRVPLN